MSTTLDPVERPAAPRPRRFRAWRWALRLALVAAAAVVVYLLVTLVQVVSASRQDAAASADAIVVLGAAQYDCDPSPVLERRLDHALELYESGVASTIVVTGGKRQGDRCTEAEAGAAHLRAAGVPDADLLLEVRGRNSWESLAAAARILRERDLAQVVLVTDGYHALRVKAIADELGLDPSVSPSREGGSAGEYLRETGAVALGRVVGFDRLVDLDTQVDQNISDDSPAAVDEPTASTATTAATDGG